LRSELRTLQPAINLFNPRGEAVPYVDIVRRYAGIVLTCLDPDSRIESTIFLTADARAVFTQWRRAAVQELDVSLELATYVRAWQKRVTSRRWPREVAALDLLYAVAHWFPDLYDDPEAQLYLELFARQLNAAEQLSGFRGRVITDPSGNVEKGGLTIADQSVRALLSDFLSPIANGVLTVNEDLIEDFPRRRVAVLSIHQAKGLEFPLVIVDVGSAFKTDHRAQGFKRFHNRWRASSDGRRTAAVFPAGQPRRKAVDRAFDDLYRQYFVAFSRAREVLVLAGLRSAAPCGGIPNVALGWTRTGSSTWATNPPYCEI
jgi:DNA helicase-2/ATP-dependent DNA helicase PcrA